MSKIKISDLPPPERPDNQILLRSISFLKRFLEIEMQFGNIGTATACEAIDQLSKIEELINDSNNAKD